MSKGYVGPLDQDWYAAEKKKDPNFKGSLWEEMGYEDTLCPTCGAHLREGICLNACHLCKASQKRLAALLEEAAQSVKKGAE